MFAIPDWCGQLRLLVIQPSPFCNLDCDYCYLPNRNDSRKMDLDTLQAVARKIFSAKLPGTELSIIWHAGEPLTVSREWYVSAFAILNECCPTSVKITHNFQTNGVLIDDDWIDFFKEHRIRVGVSIDGPDWLHDCHRKTRDARGTHSKVMNGIGYLKKANFPFHIICVLTQNSLSYPNEIFDFFRKLNPTQLCFNIEEIESANKKSSLAIDPLQSVQAYHLFMKQILLRKKQEGENLLAENCLDNSKKNNTFEYPGMRIREIDDVLMGLRNPAYGHMNGNTQNLAGHIVSVSWDGCYSTFSPELLGQKLPNEDDMSLGNLLVDPIPPRQDNVNYINQLEAIQAGIKQCKVECEYFNLCLGGSPANKLGEIGRFDCTETLFCKLTKKTMIDVVLDRLDDELPKIDN